MCCVLAKIIISRLFHVKFSMKKLLERLVVHWLFYVGML